MSLVLGRCDVHRHVLQQQTQPTHHGQDSDVYDCSNKETALACERASHIAARSARARLGIIEKVCTRICMSTSADICSSYTNHRSLASGVLQGHSQHVSPV